MRVAIDGRALTGRFTGDRTYWRGLLGGLLTAIDDFEYIVYSRLPLPDGELANSNRVRTRVLPAPSDRVWTMLTLPTALREDRADLVHVQYTTPPRALCPCPIVTTIHDISFKLFPQWFPRKDRILLNLTIPGSMRAASMVITDSESSRRDILRAYCIAEEKVAAIPLGLPNGYSCETPLDGAESKAVLDKYGLRPPYVLAVGVLQPRKNLNVLAEAFGRAKARRGLPHQLVIAGKVGWSTDGNVLKAAARRGGGEDSADAVHFTGYIDDTDLPTLYRSADLFAYPSLYEGFGIPPIEAMACGTPVIVSDSPALPEVVGDAARIVAATDIEAWAQALAEMLNDEPMRTRYRKAGLVRSARFTWSAAAEQTVSVYKQAAASR